MGDNTTSLSDLIHRAINNIAGHFVGESDNDGLLLVDGESALSHSESCDDCSEEAHVCLYV